MSGYSLASMLALVGMLVLTVSCGGGENMYRPLQGEPIIAAPGLIAETAPESPLRQISIEKTLAELAVLETPPGVNPDFFAELKSAFEEMLTSLYDENGNPVGKAVSGLSVPEMTKAWAASCKQTPGGELSLTWLGRHTGDYDLNSEVNVSDITPLGIHFGGLTDFDEEGLPVESGVNEHMAQVDGDSNGEINISDITQIGLNFASLTLGYRVYLGHSADGVNFTWLADYIPDPGGDETVSAPFNSNTGQGEVLHYSLTFGQPTIPEGETLYMRIVPFDGSTEGLELIIPAYDGPHAKFECSSCHTRVNFDFLGQENTCSICHSTPPEAGGTWSDAPVLHQTCDNCHKSHKFSVDPPESACSTCHSSIATQLTGSTMTACLDCHKTPHLPDAQPSTADCASCHADQAAGIADEAMSSCSTCHNEHVFSQSYEPATCIGCHANPDDNIAVEWALAPGLHGTCSSCHELHNFSVDAPNALCANCHESVISGGHAGGKTDCLSCHGSPHVPQIMDLSDCTSCHTNPPENPAASWGDAPGLHNQCLNCHPGDHPDKPVPAERDCMTCHSEGWDAVHLPEQTACLTCHTFPHLPELTLASEDCQSCHTDYIGDGNHTGSCLDCHRSTLHPPQDGWVYCFECHEI